MSASKKPSMSSSRIQRAMRLNTIEDSRLNQNLALMHKEKMHNARLINQHIRVINLTMDFIQASSGDSPEGLPKDTTYKVYHRQRTVGPCFLYGERVESRRFGKFRRSDSSASMATNDETLSYISSLSEDSDKLPSLVSASQPVGFMASSSGRNRLRRQSPSPTVGSLYGSSIKRITPQAKNAHRPSNSSAYPGPPRLGSLQSPSPGFSRAGSGFLVSNVPREDDDLGERIKSAISKVQRQSKINAEVEREIGEIRRKKQAESVTYTAEEYMERRRQLVQSAASVSRSRPAQRSGSPTKQREVIELKRMAHSARQRRVDEKVIDFLNSNPLRKYSSTAVVD